MSWGDVRGLLQYVPQFRGKVFVVVIDAPVPALAETMLDLVSLHDIGVQLVIGSTVHSTDDLLDRAAEVELSVEEVVDLISPDSVTETLKRGQVAIADFTGENPLSNTVATFAHAIGGKKLILLRGAGEDLPKGAMRAVEVASDSDQIMRSAAAACQIGIPRVHVLDGETPGVLLSELFSNEGVGTMVYADSYRAIRPLRDEDIVELLGMIGRSVRNAHLVPRDFAAVAEKIEDYSVMEIDGNVVGSVALYRYSDEKTAEIACLYVKQSHEGLGYASELVIHAESQAKQAGIASVFALTNRAAEFFQQLGYTEQPSDHIPADRHQQLLASGRGSRVFGKELG